MFMNIHISFVYSHCVILHVLLTFIKSDILSLI